jgi:hypothetical protein
LPRGSGCVLFAGSEEYRLQTIRAPLHCAGIS